jgi:hypothetical protein
VDAHTFTNQAQKKFKQALSAIKLMANIFWDKRIANGEIHATRDHKDVRSILQNTKKLCIAIQNKRHGTLPSGVVLLHDNVYLHTAAHIQALLEHFNCESFDHSPYSPDLAPSDYHLFIHLRN